MMDKDQKIAALEARIERLEWLLKFPQHHGDPNFLLVHRQMGVTTREKIEAEYGAAQDFRLT